MKVNFFPKDEPYIVEKIRKLSTTIFILIPTDIKEEEKQKIEELMNCEIPETFTGEGGEINILFVNEQLIVLGGINHTETDTDYDSDFDNDLKAILKKMIDVDNIYRNRDILMIYTNVTNINDDIKETIYELNGVYKAENKSNNDIYNNIFISE